jgi:phage repressor protein C with HTH and peptisase S24 domain
MEPTITDKAVIVMRKDTELKSKDIGVFILNGEAYVKRFFKKNNIIILYSDNSEYSPIIVDEYDDFIICGKVIKTLNEIK